MPNPLWITYAWADNEEGDFDFLVQELVRAGVPAMYDKIALVAGLRLWDQIAERISSDSLSGWAYLLTEHSLASQACKEELSYALQRALETQGDEFPLIGLLHGVAFSDVPLALRVRLCVSLSSPDWIEEILGGTEGLPPQRSVSNQHPFVMMIHDAYFGRTALEIRPRFGDTRYWRWAFPSSGPQPISWGTGPANGGGIGAITHEALEGEYGDIGGIPMKFVGAGNPISPSTSAYAVFDRTLPDKFFFGVAREPFGTEADGRVILVASLR